MNRVLPASEVARQRKAMQQALEEHPEFKPPKQDERIAKLEDKVDQFQKQLRFLKERSGKSKTIDLIKIEGIEEAINAAEPIYVNVGQHAGKIVYDRDELMKHAEMLKAGNND